MPPPPAAAASKPNGNGGVTLPAVKTPLPKSLQNPTRHRNRPRRRYKIRNFSFRYCLCRTCFWSVVVLILLLLFAGVASAAFYFIYRPQCPSFSVAAVRVSRFNLTTSPADGSTNLTAAINVTLSATNPSKRILSLCDPLSISVLWDPVVLTNGSVTDDFRNSTGSIYVIRASMGATSQVLDASSARSMESDLKKRGGLAMKIHVDSIVRVKIGKAEKKFWIRVQCDGIRWAANVNFPSANTDNAKCRVDLTVSIWKLFSFVK
ncbi:hypothetical protein M569_01448 [Genlisea aurea]|uniref:Late embryogenesis abundant protein LEA-2 subgroup domain-containing protein n=1 Tax=Genlisea aurea TaxID=192259 RepID=S8D1Q0_9LAMI|nr:hypothetical protein M569_01448 [Genlisea aurea]